MQKKKSGHNIVRLVNAVQVSVEMEGGWGESMEDARSGTGMAGERDTASLQLWREGRGIGGGGFKMTLAPWPAWQPGLLDWTVPFLL